jgi:hypothetical protein
MLQFLIRHGKGLDREDLSSQIPERGALRRLEGEKTLEDVVGRAGDGEDGSEKVRVVDICSEGLVVGAGLSPWIPPAREVDEYDSQRPDIV